MAVNSYRQNTACVYNPGSMTLSSDSSSDNDGINEVPSEPAMDDSLKQDWIPTQRAWDKFLDRLSPDREEAAKKYETLRIKLIRFFEWRGCDLPDCRSDQTMDRVMRKLDEGQVITNLGGFIYGVARRVAKEDLRNRDRVRALDEDVQLTPNPSNSESGDLEDPDHRLSCFDRCLESLPEDNRKLILSYYQEEGRAKIDWRQQLAEQLGIPLNALRIRAHRIRKTLEQCVQDCLLKLTHTKC
jgi:RNA polymerase sigma factor (sigma-70 family)